MIPLFWPSYNGKKIQQAMKKMFPANMSNRWLGQGELVNEFEEKFGKKFGYRYCVSVNSGSAALELAYHLIGIKEGDEVIAPVLTCTATNIPLLRLKAQIVFADVKDDLTISPADVLSKITKKTKAIVAVTLGGMPIDEELFKVASVVRLPVVIDAAQSVGVREWCGDYIAYSFQAIKHFTTGDGGMLVVQKEKDYQRAKKLRWFGIDREKKIEADWQPYKRREMTMNIEEAGYKFHMNDIAASIGLVGLNDSDKYLEHRRKIGEYYREHLQCPVITGGAYWLCGVLVEHRDQVAQYLKEHGIETNMAHLRNDIFTVFGGKRLPLPNMNRLESQYLYIPINLKVSLKDAKYITGVLNTALKKGDNL